MARRKTTTLTEVELEFMQIVWRLKEVSAEQVHVALADEGREIADGAVRRMLAILMEKGYLTRRREGKEYLYRPRVEKEQAVSSIFLDLKRRLFGGSETVMLASLLDTLHITSGELDEIRQQLDERTEEDIL